jgi:endonuclease YncB( thermonuclease family)
MLKRRWLRRPAFRGPAQIARSAWWRVDGVDVRLPLLIVVLLGLAAGGGLARQQAGSASEVKIVGTASVIDGDTIEIHGIRIRLESIDAPESVQTCLREGTAIPCGRQAAFHLSDRIGRRPVSCVPKGTDRYGRTLAVCFEAGEDLNRLMVIDGQAVAYRQFSRRYVGEENAARAARSGIWGTEFEMPWEWRRDN